MNGPSRPVGQMEADLRELILTVQSPHLSAVLEHLLGPGTTTWALYREAPAAKRIHQAYRHGLLEHCLTVAQAVSAISAVFGSIHRDLALTGALLHDIGKVDAYTIDGEQIEMSDLGRLHGEIALGYFRIRSAIAELPGFPEELAQGLLHIILSHHGCLEFGSPVVPATREATLVHMADNLGSKLGSFDRIEAGLDVGALWAGFDRGLGTSAWFAPGGPSAAGDPGVLGASRARAA
ncbi:MAG TPA: HD domain-containing protein [Solirubrobacteraceae bacterium]|nr:HD domain-containing protein [Solirubrobacteraceae bacterium]